MGNLESILLGFIGGMIVIYPHSHNPLKINKILKDKAA